MMLLRRLLIPSTPSSVISSCAACDVHPSIHLYKRLAGRRQGPLRAGFICFSSATPAAEDHITSASIRRTPGENEGVEAEWEGHITIMNQTFIKAPSLCFFGELVSTGRPRMERNIPATQPSISRKWGMMGKDPVTRQASGHICSSSCCCS
eukprot:superscaffoldBa00002448_g14267